MPLLTQQGTEATSLHQNFKRSKVVKANVGRKLNSY